MLYLPVTLLLFLIFLLLFPFVWLTLTIDIVEVAVAKLGFSSTAAFWLLAAVIVGSTLNIPLYRRTSEVALMPDFSDLWLRQFWGIPLPHVRQTTVVALNVGGGLIPVLLAIYELFRSNAIAILLVAALVTVVSYFSAQVVPGIGIQMNALVAPLIASLGAILIDGAEAPAIALPGAFSVS